MPITTRLAVGPKVEPEAFPLLRAFLAGLAWDLAVGAGLLAAGAVGWWLLRARG